MTEQDILDYINEFTSKNDVPMIKGKYFNWEKKYYRHGDPNTWDRYIYVGDMGVYKSVWYFRKEKVLIINSEKFYCETPELAEEYVLAWLKGNDREIGRLYTKEYELESTKGY